VIGRVQVLGVLIALGAALLLGGAEAGATAPGANGRIAYEFFDDNFNTTLRDVRPGGRPRRLTVLPRRCRPADRYSWHDERPRYSPDGNWIAYFHEDNCRRSNNYRGQIRLLRADGGAMRVLVSWPNQFSYLNGAMYPVFSADGARILFIARGSRTSRAVNRLWIINVETGSALRRLRVPTGFFGSYIAYETFDWSPDGRLALPLAPRHRPAGIYSGRPGARLRNYRRIATERFGGGLRSFTSAIDWAPNGASMLFERTLVCIDSEDPDCPIDSDAELRDVYRVSTKGKPRVRRLTWSGASGTPVFSPDGRSMAFADSRGIVIRRLNRGPARAIAGAGYRPTWQPVTAATIFH